MPKKQIVAFCGCFNPPLYSHFSLAEQILNEYEQVDRILFVPVSEKYDKVDLTCNEHRYNMLKLVCDKNNKFEISTIEMDNERQLYTVETLRKLQEIYKEYEIALAIGSDNLKELNTWKLGDELVEEFKIYVFKRDRDNIEDIINSNDFLKSNKNSFIEVHNGIISNASSTFAREKIRNGKSIRYLTSDEVIQYINENKLYIC